MTAIPITDGIDIVAVTPLGQGALRVEFSSPHAALCHQLYVNGVLAEWTDQSEQRSFPLSRCVSPAMLAVVAVEEADRQADLSGQLPPEQVAPPWQARLRVPRSVQYLPGQSLEAVELPAEGAAAARTLASEEFWPVWLPRWAGASDDPFGADLAALAGEGLGLGLGAFGAGDFGVDADTVDLTLTFNQDGAHAVQLRVTDQQGLLAQGPVRTFQADLPPQPPAGLSVVAYDGASELVTLSIQERTQP
jgi:hypothetical protein